MEELLVFGAQAAFPGWLWWVLRGLFWLGVAVGAVALFVLAIMLIAGSKHRYFFAERFTLNADRDEIERQTRQWLQENRPDARMKAKYGPKRDRWHAKIKYKLKQEVDGTKVTLKTRIDLYQNSEEFRAIAWPKRAKVRGGDLSEQEQAELRKRIDEQAKADLQALLDRLGAVPQNRQPDQAP